MFSDKDYDLKRMISNESGEFLPVVRHAKLTFHEMCRKMNGLGKLY